MKKGVVVFLFYLFFLNSSFAFDFFKDETILEKSLETTQSVYSKVTHKEVKREEISEAIGTLHSIAEFLKLFPLPHEFLGKDVPIEATSHLMRVQGLLTEVIWAERFLKTYLGFNDPEDLTRSIQHLKQALEIYN